MLTGQHSATAIARWTKPVIGNSGSGFKSKVSICNQNHSSHGPVTQSLGCLQTEAGQIIQPAGCSVPPCAERYTTGTAVSTKLCKLWAIPISLSFHKTLCLHCLNLFLSGLLTNFPHQVKDQVHYSRIISVEGFPFNTALKATPAVTQLLSIFGSHQLVKLTHL